jgi:hypothetical protein
MENQQQFNYNNINSKFPNNNFLVSIFSVMPSYFFHQAILHIALIIGNTMQDPNQNQGAGSQYQQHLNTGSSPQQNQFQNQSVGVARGQYDAQDRFINMTSPSQ